MVQTQPGELYRILVVDDEEVARQGLKRILDLPDRHIDCASNGEEALKLIEDAGVEYHLVVTDFRMPKMDGKHLLERLVKERPLTKVIVVTGKGSTSAAVECMKAGAYDYIEKPFDMVLIRAAVERALRESQLAEDNLQLRKTLSLGSVPRSERAGIELVWEDTAMDRAVLLAQKLAMTDDPVLIEGESGSGKELLARTIHQASRVRSKGFVAINCGALSEELLVSELFGYERGAFTGANETKLGIFETTNGGTLFLDEIGELPLAMQARFLRVLEEKEVFRVGGRAPVPVRFRLVAASNRNLAAMSEAGTFRKDLYFRIGVHVLTVPPLRERPDDLPVLFQYFCQRLSREGRTAPLGLTERARDLLVQYAWPGNVRELYSLVLQMTIAAPGRLVDVEDLPALIRTAVSASPAVAAGDTLENMKYEHVRQALVKAGGNRTQAARALGISRVSLHRFLARHPELSRAGKDGES